MRKLFQKYIAMLVVCAILLGLCACNLQENPTGEAKTIRATVIATEKYGHAVLDITTQDFINSGYNLGDVVCVRFESCELDMPFFDGYYTNPGDAMLRGLTPEDNLAICINYGDIFARTGMSVGDTVEISLAEKAGMLALQELCALQYSNDRSDYSDDAVFANFRAVTVGKIGEGKLYRSASPINNTFGRAGHANDLIKAESVATVLNLADSEAEIMEYCAADDIDSEYYLSLYESGNVMALELGANFFTDEFAVSVAKGLSFLAQNEPPYCIHCIEGKDRTGFVIMLIEALMGADLDTIIDDYMLSFYNYYGIDKETDPERYEVVLNNNLVAILCHVAGAETKEQLSEIDLESAVTDYLLRAGMTEEDICMLQEKLR